MVCQLFIQTVTLIFKNYNSGSVFFHAVELLHYFFFMLESYGYVVADSLVFSWCRLVIIQTGRCAGELRVLWGIRNYNSAYSVLFEGVGYLQERLKSSVTVRLIYKFHMVLDPLGLSSFFVRWIFLLGTWLMLHSVL